MLWLILLYVCLLLSWFTWPYWLCGKHRLRWKRRSVHWSNEWPAFTAQRQKSYNERKTICRWGWLPNNVTVVKEVLEARCHDEKSLEKSELKAFGTESPRQSKSPLFINSATSDLLFSLSFEPLWHDDGALVSAGRGQLVASMVLLYCKRRNFRREFNFVAFV